MRRVLLTLILLCAVLVSACGGDDAEGTNSDTGAISAVEDYLQAKVSADEDGIREFICAEREGDIPLEAASFASIDASIEAMSCALDGTSGDYTLVTCSGEIVMVYGEETNTRPLATYQAIEEDGEWRWCGEGVTEASDEG